MRKKISLVCILSAFFLASTVFATTVNLTLESFAPANFPTVSKILDIPDINDQLEISRQAARFALSPQGWNLQNMASGGILAELSPLYYSNPLYYVRVNVPYGPVASELIHLFGYDLTQKGAGVGGPCYTLWFHTDLWVARLFHVIGERPNNYGTIGGGMGGTIWWQTPLPNLGRFSITPVVTLRNSAPRAVPTGGGTYGTNASVLLGGQVSDPDGDLLSYLWLENGTVLFGGTIQSLSGGSLVGLTPYTTSLPLGNHTVTLKVSDGINAPVIEDIEIHIIDDVAPTIAPVPDKTILWPPNHQMVDITIWPNASDNSGLPVSLQATVTSNEPQGGLGEGDRTDKDWTDPIVKDGLITLQLRSERAGNGKGRTYTVTITGIDSAGNSSTAKVNVIVPHDKGH